MPAHGTLRFFGCFALLGGICACTNPTPGGASSSPGATGPSGAPASASSMGGAGAGSPGPGGSTTPGSPGAGGKTTPATPSATPAADGGAASALQPYLHLAVGARWTYHTVDSVNGLAGDTESVVEALEDVGGAKAGTKAYRVRSTLVAGGSTVNWQEDLGTSVVRHREQFIDPNGSIGADYIFLPNRLRLDESAAHTQVGASWTETNAATVDDKRTGVTAKASYSIQWTVMAVDESVTVPAGTFSCLRVHRVQSGYSSTDEMQWFARNVGKVKETGTETHDLKSYKAP